MTTTAAARPISYLRQMAWSSGASAIGMLASIIVLSVSAHVLGRDALGTYYLVLLAMALASGIADLGLRNTAITKLSVAGDFEFLRTARFLWTVSVLGAATTALFGALLLPLMGEEWAAENVRSVAWPMAAIVFFNSLFLTGGAIMVGAKKVRTLSTITAASELIRLVVSVSAVLMGYGVESLLYALLLSRLLGVGMILNAYPGLLRPAFTAPDARKLLRFGGVLYSTSLISLATFRLADTLLARLLGPAGLAVYSTAMQFPALMQRGFDSIRPVLLSYISSQGRDAAEAAVESVRLLSGLLAVASVLVICFSEPLILLGFSDEFRQSIPVLRVLAAWSSVSLVNYLLTVTLTGMMRGRGVLALAMPQLVIMIPLCLLLVPAYEALGAAGSLLITSVVGNILGFYLLAKDRGDRLFVRFVWAFGRSAIAVAGVLLAAALTDSTTVLATTAIAALSWLLLAEAVRPKDFRFLWSRINMRGQ